MNSSNVSQFFPLQNISGVCFPARHLSDLSGGVMEDLHLIHSPQSHWFQQRPNSLYWWNICPNPYHLFMIISEATCWKRFIPLIHDVGISRNHIQSCCPMCQVLIYLLYCISRFFSFWRKWRKKSLFFFAAPHNTVPTALNFNRLF